MFIENGKNLIEELEKEGGIRASELSFLDCLVINELYATSGQYFAMAIRSEDRKIDAEIQDFIPFFPTFERKNGKVFLTLEAEGTDAGRREDWVLNGEDVFVMLV